MKAKIPLSIYIHIPFCPTKCIYCDFLSFCGGGEHFAPYTAALCAHLAHAAEGLAGHEVQTVFFGGGTPTMLSAAGLQGILDSVRANCNLAADAVISTEANPETVDLAYLRAIRAAGFNRISLGVQSFDDRLLRAIGRIHSAARAAAAVKDAHAAGFDDINIDLIFALPYQTMSDFAASLDTAAALPITHISCYGLTVEDATPLAARRDLLAAMGDDELDRAMYHMAKERLAAAGFGHYEISNWAKEGRECKHNIGYWTGREYAGFGIGAHSFLGRRRFCNSMDLAAYCGGDFSAGQLEKVDIKAAKAEFVILGLRLTGGITGAEFARRFGHDIFAQYGGVFRKLAAQNLVVVEGDNIRLTARGLDLANTVFAEFV